MCATSSSIKATREARPLMNRWHVSTKHPFSRCIATNSSIHTDPRPEATLLQISEALLGFLGLAEEKTRFRVEVEREHHRGLLALRPRIAHGG
jgi:hypothetical protein